MLDVFLPESRDVGSPHAAVRPPTMYNNVNSLQTMQNSNNGVRGAVFNGGIDFLESECGTPLGACETIEEEEETPIFDNDDDCLNAGPILVPMSRLGSETTPFTGFFSAPPLQIATSPEATRCRSHSPLDGIFLSQERLDIHNTSEKICSESGSAIVSFSCLAKSTADLLNIDPDNPIDCSYVGVSLREMVHGVRCELPLQQVYIALHLGPVKAQDVKFFVMVSSNNRKDATMALSMLTDSIEDLCT
eukprot:CAMPEP_0196574884 /NCGR_PEP_ID=MMETSP1081-20130531/4489_1 /TAXON_ID=36882 /ORGANISM="Pyramimonas amylifera, Strain CCMP720" /LENGTH=246 /DNA_ID=CAMNT_0041893025 /DNA_START=870 /DNA_END=1610 /DNA_ORIENTATION=+